jgi:hypothetical protein
VVVTVIVDVAVVDAVVGVKVHPGKLDAPLGLVVIAQVKATEPVNPVLDATVMVDVVVPPGLLIAVAALPLREKVAPAGLLTVTPTVVFSVRPAEVPVTVIV